LINYSTIWYSCSRLLVIDFVRNRTNLMIAPTMILPQGSAERSRLLVTNEMRRRALQRLYERRSAVDHLIQSLEEYRRSADQTRESECILLSAAR